MLALFYRVVCARFERGSGIGPSSRTASRTGAAAQKEFSGLHGGFLVVLHGATKKKKIYFIKTKILDWKSEHKCYYLHY